MRIAIASGKGGTGKTTLAVNLAQYAAETSEVLLADLDVEEPNSGIFIDAILHNERTIVNMVPVWHRELCLLCGACAERCMFNAVLQLGKEIVTLPQLCHSCYACSELCPTASLSMEPMPIGTLKHLISSKLTFIESKLFVGIEQAVPMISQTIDYLSENSSGSKLEIWDSPPGTSCPVIEVVDGADFVLLVTEPTPFGLWDLNLAVETMYKLGKPFAVIVNRWGIGNDAVIRYCKSKDISIWTLIPDQRRIAELYSAGKLIFPYVAEFRKGLDDIMERLTDLEGQLCMK